MIVKGDTIPERLNFLKENKELVMAQKMTQKKECASIPISYNPISEDQGVYKANVPFDTTSIEEFKVRPIINTTNIIDGHLDLHMPKLWKKNLSENKRIMHVREHQSQKFDYIISAGKDLKTYTQIFTWAELGYPKWNGSTEALVFDSTIKLKRNPFMFEQYANGWVDNHSVGMQYVRILMAVNSDEEYWKEEKKNWDKYLIEAVNPEVAEQWGYFFIVLEAKAIEGSAVPNGSNFATPTLENNLKTEPNIVHPVEPLKDTRVLEALEKLKSKIVI